MLCWSWRYCPFKSYLYRGSWISSNSADPNGLPIYASGPMSHLFHGVHEQHYCASLVSTGTIQYRWYTPIRFTRSCKGSRKVSWVTLNPDINSSIVNTHIYIMFVLTLRTRISSLVWSGLLVGRLLHHEYCPLASHSHITITYWFRIVLNSTIINKYFVLWCIFITNPIILCAK